MTMCAPRKSGKSYFIKKLLNSTMLDRFHHVIIMCPTLDFNDDYEAFRHNKKFTFITDVTDAKVEELFERQARCMRKVRKRKRDKFSNLSELECPNTLLILDDCVDSGVMQFKGSIDKLAERSRHINFSVILASQRITAVSMSVRVNSDYFIIFSPHCIQELESYIEKFVPRQEIRQRIQEILDVFETPYEFVMIDNTEKNPRKKMKHSNAERFIGGKATSMFDTSDTTPPKKRRRK